MRKTILFLLAVLLLATASYAQLQVSIIEYDPESRFARIQILHAGDQDYHELYFAMDNEQPEKLVGLIRPQTAIVIGKLVTPGEHAVKLSTLEGAYFTQTLLFAKSESLVQKEQQAILEKQAQAEAALREASSPAPPPLVMDIPAQEDDIYTPEAGAIAILLAMLLFFLVVLSALRRKKKPKPLPGAAAGSGTFKPGFVPRRSFRPMPHFAGLRHGQRRPYRQFSYFQKAQKPASPPLAKEAVKPQDIFTQLKEVKSNGQQAFSRLKALAAGHRAIFKKPGDSGRKQKNG